MSLRKINGFTGFVKRSARLSVDVRDGLEHVAQSVALLEERCAVLLSDTTEGVEVVEDAEEIVSVCLC
jgi:hypothetical protein